MGITPPPDIAAALAERYVFVAQTRSFWDRISQENRDDRTVRAMHSHETETDVVRFLLADATRKVDRLGYFPRQGRRVEERGISYENLWQPSPIPPTPGDPAPFLDHIHYLFDDDPVAIRYALDWMAHLLQYPDIKQSTGLVLSGQQGTGKSLLAELLTRLIGDGNANIISGASFHSPFNDWLAHKSLIVVEEAACTKDAITKGVIKTLLTSRTVQINRKFVPAYETPNLAHFFILSNEVVPIQIDPDDRRFFVWRTQAPPRPPEAYADLVSWLNWGGDGIVLDFLLTRDLAGYSPHARPPATNSRTDLLTASLSPVEQFLRDAFDSGEPPLDRDVTTVRHIQEYLIRQTRYQPSPKEIGRILRALGATELGQKRIGGQKPHLWALRDHDRWKAASERDIGLHMPDAPIPTPMPTRRSARKAH